MNTIKKTKAIAIKLDENRELLEQLAAVPGHDDYEEKQATDEALVYIALCRQCADLKIRARSCLACS